jgi:type I restriction enzyme, S subunit
VTQLRPYPSYKPSGVPWLGDVPEHWDVLPNRALFTEVKERDHPEEQMLSVTITKGVIRQQALLADRSKKDSSNLDKSAYKFLRPGDIAYNKMRAWQGAVGVSDLRGIVSPAYVVQRPREGANPRYFHYLLRTPAFAKEAERWSYGIASDMWSLRPEHFKMIYGCLPSLPEQSAIVRYSDHVDRRTRKYIRAKQQLVGLLHEHKRAIIHSAVTRGLDPNVKLKPSGVLWLGDTPECWGTMPSKRLFTVREETALPGDEQLSATQAYGVIPQEEFERRVGRRVVHVMQHLEKRRHVERDDFVVSMRSFQGGLERAWATGCIRSSYVVLKPSAKVHVGYFAHVFKSYGYIRALQATANFIRDGQDLNFNHFCLVDLPVVPMQEQKAIASFLDRAADDIDTAISHARREIELLREYRTRLVADVVTGKLDVREASANLPEEAEEVEEPEAEAEDLEEANEEASGSQDVEDQG